MIPEVFSIILNHIAVMIAAVSSHILPKPVGRTKRACFFLCGKFHFDQCELPRSGEDIQLCCEGPKRDPVTFFRNGAAGRIPAERFRAGLKVSAAGQRPVFPRRREAETKNTDSVSGRTEDGKSSGFSVDM